MAGLGIKKCKKCFQCESACPSGALQLIGKEYSVRQLVDIIKRDEMFYSKSAGGVTLSGGEPLMQHEFVLELVTVLKRLGYHVAIETCGYSDPEHAQKILTACDVVLFDIKHMDDELHKKTTGVGNELILTNLQLLAGTKSDSIVVRMPVIGGFNDDFKNIDAMAHMMCSLNLKTVHLLSYHNYGKSKYASLGLVYDFCGDVTPEKVEALRRRFIDRGIACIIGG